MAGSARAEMIIIQPGAEGKDTISAIYTPTTNFGTLDRLPTSCSTGYGQEAFIEFDLSILTPGMHVDSAELSLYLYGTSGSGTASVTVHGITESWTEGGLTWNNHPADDNGAYDTIQVAATPVGMWKTWDVTELVDEWYQDPSTNHGFVLKNSGSEMYTQFRSSAYSAIPGHRPKLEVTLIPEPSTLVLLGIGAVGLIALGRRWRKTGAAG